MDLREWSKKFPVLSISRLYLRRVMGFSQEAVERLTDEDMQRIADAVMQSYSYSVFCDRVRVIATTVLQDRPQEETMNSSEWSKKYDVLSISRLYLHQTLGFSPEGVESLTDEDMQRIADMLIAQYFDHEFEEDVRFLTACAIAEKAGGADDDQLG